MAVENLPVWPFPPNWEEAFTESLQWLTDIMMSPTGAEQRRPLRPYPRRSYEYGMALFGNERQLFENLVATYGSSEFYFPLWHEVYFVSSTSLQGQRILKCNPAVMNVRVGDVLYVTGDNVFLGELLEVSEILADGLRMTSNIRYSRAYGERIFLSIKSKLDSQPSSRKLSSSVKTATIRMNMTSPTSRLSEDAVALPQYRSFSVLEDAPDESEDLTASYERLVTIMDNQIAIPRWQDTANRPFEIRQHSWFLQGREAHRKFIAMFLDLKGQVYPIWIPSFNDDFSIAADISASGMFLTVENSGFTNCGGPRPERQDIRIETIKGVFYRRITLSSIALDGHELLVLNAALGQSIARSDVIQISFMNLMRLNQDAIQIDYQTDNEGISSTSVNFRSAPDLRVPGVGF